MAEPQVQPSPASLRLAEESLAQERATFARRTLFHLAGTLVALVAIVALLLSFADLQTPLFGWLAGANWRWLALLGVSFLIGWLAHTCGRKSDSPLLPYVGLLLSVLLEACLVWPLLLLARHYDGQTPIAALLMTIGLIAGLVGLAGMTRERFAVRAVVVWLTLGTVWGAVVAVLLTGWSPGVLITCSAMVLIAGLLVVGLVLVIPHHNPDQVVAATQALLAVAATLVWLGVRKAWQLYLSQE